MRWYLLCLVLGLAAHQVRGQGGFGSDNDASDSGYTERHYHKAILKLTKQHFILSLNYLYTGIGYGNQVYERNGLAKYLRELSTSHWEAGMDTVKKFIAKGGKIDVEFYNLQATNDLHMVVKPSSDAYLKTLNGLVTDSKKISKELNKIYKMVTNSKDGNHDGDWANFAIGQLKTEAKRLRKMEGDVTTFKSLKYSPLAISVFDENLE